MKTLTTPRTTGMLNSRREHKREGGQILVLFVLAIVVLMGLTAMVIDVGVLRNANQNLWNALDAGALAGAPMLPAEAGNAEAIALDFADRNYPGGLPAGVTVGFRCVVGSLGGNPRVTDIPSVCDPGSNPSWTCNAKLCSTVCVPAEGDACNTIVLEGTATVGYGFGNAVGVASGTTQVVLSAACKGACGTKPDDPVDLVLLVDRTPSLEAIDVVNARTATDAVRTTYRAADQWIALGMIGPSEDSGSCLTAPDPSLGTANVPADLRRWVPVALSGIGAPIHNEDYRNSSSTLATNIACFTRSSGPVATDLEDPIPAAQYELLNNGREGVTKGIILMSDGQPNNSVDGGRFTPGYDYCQRANETATAAKNAGIVIFTIAFGLDGSENIDCLDDSGPFAGKKATALLAAMATDSFDDNGCPGTENDDNDHYFCVPKTENANPNLANLFRQAANALVGGTKLIKLPS
ncbi:MAG: pilus assembly protein TadG-related protein [Aeromicrobium sp.]